MDAEVGTGQRHQRRRRQQRGAMRGTSAPIASARRERGRGVTGGEREGRRRAPDRRQAAKPRTPRRTTRLTTALTESDGARAPRPRARSPALAVERRARERRRPSRAPRTHPSSCRRRGPVERRAVEPGRAARGGLAIEPRERRVTCESARRTPAACRAGVRIEPGGGARSREPPGGHHVRVAEQLADDKPAGGPQDPAQLTSAAS